MENGKQPIAPQTYTRDGYNIRLEGLTKREYFAGLAMQSCLSNGKCSNAEDWLRLADALLAELDKNRTK
jgi:hypothetical protein